MTQSSINIPEALYWRAQTLARGRAPMCPPCGCIRNCSHGYVEATVADATLDVGQWAWVTPPVNGRGYDHRVRYGIRVGPITTALDQYDRECLTWGGMLLGRKVDERTCETCGLHGPASPEANEFRDWLEREGLITTVLSEHDQIHFPNSQPGNRLHAEFRPCSPACGQANGHCGPCEGRSHCDHT